MPRLVPAWEFYKTAELDRIAVAEAVGRLFAHRSIAELEKSAGIGGILRRGAVGIKGLFRGSKAARLPRHLHIGETTNTLPKPPTPSLSTASPKAAPAIHSPDTTVHATTPTVPAGEVVPPPNVPKAEAPGKVVSPEEVAKGEAKAKGRSWKTRALLYGGTLAGLYGIYKAVPWVGRQLEMATAMPMAAGKGWSPVPYGYEYSPYGPGAPQAVA